MGVPRYRFMQSGRTEESARQLRNMAVEVGCSWNPIGSMEIQGATLCSGSKTLLGQTARAILTQRLSLERKQFVPWR